MEDMFDSFICMLVPYKHMCVIAVLQGEKGDSGIAGVDGRKGDRGDPVCNI